MMHISMIFDPDACICDAGFFRVGPTNERTDEQADSRSWMMHIYMTLDPDACMCDAGMNDAYIHDP